MEKVHVKDARRQEIIRVVVYVDAANQCNRNKTTGIGYFIRSNSNIILIWITYTIPQTNANTIYVQDVVLI